MNGAGRTTEMRRIIVALDGSRPSGAAVRRAPEEARLTGGVVEAVTSWDQPGVYGLPMTVSAEAPDEVAGATLAEVVAWEAIPEPGVVRGDGWGTGRPARSW
jgi:nucleotide-binding universal stress UspA family protein